MIKEIQFLSADKQVGIKERTGIKNLLKKLFINENKVLEEFKIICCSDKYLKKINKKYLDHDFLTDTITFNLSDKIESINGESYISLDRIKTNAKIYNSSYQTELLRVIIHSALHLCGYKDDDVELKSNMHDKENEYLKIYSRETS